MFDECFNPPSSDVSPFPVVDAPRAVEIAGSPSLTTLDQDAPSSSTSSTNQQQQSSTKDHPLANVIGDPSRPVSTRKQLETDVMSCYFDAFLTSVELKNFKEAMLESSWIEAMVLKSKARLLLKDSGKRRESNLRNQFAPVARIESHPMIVDQDNPSHVYKLKKALYGLKQAPRAWYDMLSSFSSHKIFSKGTINMGLWYSKDTGMSLTAYSDADHTGCQDTRRSTSGSAQFLGDKLVSWSSKKQKSTAISTNKLWVTFNKIPLYCDNKSAIDLCCNNVQHSRAKHIDVRYHFIKEQVENGIVELYFVRTEYQLADIFTKPLPRERFNFLIEKLGMRSMSPKTLKRLTEEEDE
ncbi:copia protein [Tanacetum coccineum]